MENIGVYSQYAPDTHNEYNYCMSRDEGKEEERKGNGIKKN